MAAKGAAAAPFGPGLGDCKGGVTASMVTVWESLRLSEYHTSVGVISLSAQAET
jgi:hypothetical protein